MKNSLETRLGIFVALAVISAVVIIEMLGGPEHFMRGNKFYAMFNSVQELKVGDRVKMAGVEIGRVEKIELAENQAKVKVTLKVRTNSGVKTDSTASVKFTGLMGQNFVAIDFGSPSAPPAADGTVLNTAEQPDLSSIMVKLDNVATGVENLTKTFTGDQINNLLGPFTDFLKANKDPLTASIANMRNISSQIASGQGTVGKLIYDDSLYNSALATVTNLQSTIGDARTMMAEVEAGQGTAGKLLKDETLYNETTASMRSLKEILQKINQGQGTVGKLINDPEFYKNAKLSLQKLDKATEGLEDQGPLSVLGIAVNSLL